MIEVITMYIDQADADDGGPGNSGGTYTEEGPQIIQIPTTE